MKRLKIVFLAICVLTIVSSCAPALSSCPGTGFDNDPMYSAPMWARKDLVKKMTTNHHEGRLHRK